MAQVGAQGGLISGATITGSLYGGGGGAGNNGIATAAYQQERTFTRDGTTIIVRYEKVENGWVVQIAQHEGDRVKRYIAETLDDAHKQVSAYIVAERLER